MTTHRTKRYMVNEALQKLKDLNIIQDDSDASRFVKRSIRMKHDDVEIMSNIIRYDIAYLYVHLLTEFKTPLRFVMTLIEKNRPSLI